MKLKDFIIFENSTFIAINKPQGLIVNKSETVKQETLQDLVEEYFHSSQPSFQRNEVTEESLSSDYNSLDPSSSFDKLKTTLDDGRIYDEFNSRSGIVHRLDKDTSGVILIAKNVEAFGELKSLFLNRKIKKTYCAVVWGDISALRGDYEYIKVNMPIGRNPKNRHKFAIVESGKPAVSNIYLPHFKITGSDLEIDTTDSDYQPTTVIYKDKTFSFVKIQPKTGRTHQIRVHLKALNHEIVGDIVYSGKNQQKFSKDENVSLMLHAYSLDFNAFDKEWSIQAPFPDHFIKAVSKIWNIANG